MMKDQRGQSAVEYIMLLMVMVIIGMAIFGKMKKYILDNPDSFINSYLKSYEQVFGGGGTQGATFRYQRFPLRR
jgi:hypothetical protein